MLGWLLVVLIGLLTLPGRVAYCVRALGWPLSRALREHIAREWALWRWAWHAARHRPPPAP